MPATLSPSDQAKQRVALFSLLVAVGMLAFKALVGLHTRSLGILAEAAHSAFDLLATLMTWISLRVAARPADADHPFGHGKFENFSAFVETGLLIVTAVAIATVAIHSWLSHGGQQVHLDAWAYAVMLVSIAVDWRRAAALRRAGEQLASDALAADGLNFTADMATSLAVLAGLGLVAAGRAWHLAWLAHADAAAACVVAAAMLAMALRLGRRTAGVLLDEASPVLTRELRTTLAGVEGADLNRLRMRRVGSRYFVDLQLALEPTATLERAGWIREEVAARIRQRLPEADVVVEAQPRPDTSPGPFQRILAIAQRLNLRIHELAIFDVGTGLEVELHLERPEAEPLAQAHAAVNRLEAEIRREVGGIGRIVSHIEPEAAQVSAASPFDSARIASAVQAVARQVPEVLDCHDLQVRNANGHLALSCHCTFADSLPVARVHEVLSRLEADIQRALPELMRLTLHPEPRSDNRT